MTERLRRIVESAQEGIAIIDEALAVADAYATG